MRSPMLLPLLVAALLAVGANAQDNEGELPRSRTLIVATC
jgi:hypothetical protein